VPDAARGVFDSASRNDALTISVWIRGGASQPSPGSAFWILERGEGRGARAAQAHVPGSDGTIYWDTGRGDDCCSGSARLFRAEPTASRWKGQWNHYVFLKDGSRKEISQKS